jgi:hypothetical protein
MNEKLESYAREELKAGLAQLPADWQRMFKLMYARDGGKRSVEDAEAMPIDDVVEQVPAEKLDWAMQQVQNSLNKLSKQATA